MLPNVYFLGVVVNRSHVMPPLILSTALLVYILHPAGNNRNSTSKLFHDLAGELEYLELQMNLSLDFRHPRI